MGKPLPTHLNEIEVLQKAYGAEVVANLLHTTERAIQYWFEKPERTPRKETLRTLGELFVRHRNGEDLAKTGLSDGYKEKYLELLDKQTNSSKAILKNQALLMTLMEAVARLLAKAEKKEMSEISDQLRKATEANLEQVGIL